MESNKAQSPSIHRPIRSISSEDLQQVEALYGGFAGEPFGDDSTEYVFVAVPNQTGRSEKGFSQCDLFFSFSWIVSNVRLM